MMAARLWRFGLGVVLLLLAACYQPPQVQAPSPLQPLARRDFTEVSRVPEQREYAIVTLEALPTALSPEARRNGRFDPASPKAQAYRRVLEQQHAAFRAYLRRAAPRAEVVREYFTVLNGVAVRLNGHGLAALARGPGVRAVGFSALYRPTLNVSLDVIGASVLHAVPGLSGAGVKVGVIDTGIQVAGPVLNRAGPFALPDLLETHPFLACHAPVTHKIYASGNVPPGADPLILAFDHGTQVAGIIAGCGPFTITDGPLAGETLSGVAPGVELTDYNVFPGFGVGYAIYGGSALSHDIVQALEEAVLDGMDVVNMSLGGGVTGPRDFLAEAVNVAVEAGVVVVVSAGNSGPEKYTIESPGNAERALTVGATTNPHFVGIPVTLDLTGETFGAAVGDFNPYVPPVLGAAFAVASPAEGCAPLANDVTGKIVIIDRGDCSFTTKVRNAENAGALGVLVVNNTFGDPVAMGHDGTAPFPTIPAAMVAQDAGTLIKAAAGTSTISVNGTVQTEFQTTSADFLARFSSRGPTPYTGLVKPDVVAPGVNVVSSAFAGGAAFAFVQGTSFSAPHVSGAAALLLEAHPGWTPDEVKAALVTTADRPAHLEASLSGGDLAGLAAAQRGGGRINLEAALEVPVLVTPPVVSFGYHNPGGRSALQAVTLHLRAVSGGPVACTAEATGSVQLGATELVVDPEAELVVFLQDAARRVGDEEGEVTLTCDGRTLRVPWGSYLNPPGPG